VPEAAAPADPALADAGDAATDAGPPVTAAEVTVNPTAPSAPVAPHAFGMHASVHDNGLHHPSVPGLLGQAGITLLRWPGGGFAGNYHWSTHGMTPWYSDPTLLTPGD
jgi:hypothetical protein